MRPSRIGYQVGVNDKKLYFKPKGEPIRPGGEATIAQHPNTLGSSRRAFLPSRSRRRSSSAAGTPPEAERHRRSSSFDKAPETNSKKAARCHGSTPKLALDDDTTVYSQKEAEIRQGQATSCDQLHRRVGSCAGNPSLQPAGPTKPGEFEAHTVADTVQRFTRSGYETVFRVGHGAPESGPGGGPQSGGNKTPSFGIAIVSDNNDPQGLGRVRCKIPWLADQLQTDWCRIIMPSAGKDRGFFWLPEIGDEVMLARLGDCRTLRPRQPAERPDKAEEQRGRAKAATLPST